MIVNTDDMRNFFENYGSKTDENLDYLVSKYKITNDNSIFSSIVQKTLGVISNQAKKLGNPDFTESDAYSHGMEILLYTISKWNPEKNVSFLTLFYLYLHNKFNTLAYRSKQYRSYICSYLGKNKNNESLEQNVLMNPEKSLEELIEVDGEKSYLSMPKVFIYPQYSFIDMRLFDERPLSQKIINSLLKYNIKNKRELLECLSINEDQLKTEIKFIKKKFCLKKLV